MFAHSRGVFALDSGDLPTTQRYQGAGKRTSKERKRQRGKLVEVEKTPYGFNLVALYEVELRQVVAVKVISINPHDSNFTLELVIQARRNVDKRHGGSTDNAENVRIRLRGAKLCPKLTPSKLRSTNVL